MDSNHRRRSQQIYSLPPLATRESHRNGAGKGGRTPLTSLEGWCTADMPYPHLVSELPVPNLKNGTDEGSRTLKPCGTRTWTVRVCQFRHVGKILNCQRNHLQEINSAHCLHNIIQHFYLCKPFLKKNCFFLRNTDHKSHFDAPGKNIWKILKDKFGSRTVAPWT